MTNPRFIGPKRRWFQWSLAALWFVIPFIRISGQSLIEIDLPNLNFYLGNTIFRIEEMHLFWLLIMSVLFLFLFLTMVLGRIWCGWGCPQTAFTDLAETLARLIGMKVENNRLDGNTWQQIVLHLSYLAMALLAGFSFVWYFVPPYDFFNHLIAGSIGPWPLGTGLVIAAVVMLDLTLLRRLFCQDFCPYGRFQAIIAHPGTLTIRSLPSEIDRCIDCKACIRICPTGIDIREGFQIECINCTLCIDACREVMAPRGQQGIIDYTFGTKNIGWRALLEPRIVLMGLTSLLLAIALLYNITHRSEVTLKLRNSPHVKARLLENNQVLSFYNGHFRNLSESPLNLTIRATLEGGGNIEIKGPASLILKPNEKKFLRFGVITANPAENSRHEILFSVYSQDGKVLDNKAFITHLREE